MIPGTFEHRISHRVVPHKQQPRREALTYERSNSFHAHNSFPPVWKKERAFFSTYR